jgi:type IV fimbrial biogenesis protein FimT
MNCIARPSRQRGLSLVECTTAMAIAAAALGTVAPGFGTLKANKQLAAAAAEFETDVHLARSLAVSRNATVRISFDSQAGASCYVLHGGGAGDCTCAATGLAVCVDGVESLRVVHFPAQSQVALSANVASVVFDPVKGTSTPAGTARFVSPKGAAVHQVVNVMGRVRSCSPGKAVSGFKAC